MRLALGVSLTVLVLGGLAASAVSPYASPAEPFAAEFTFEDASFSGRGWLTAPTGSAWVKGEPATWDITARAMELSLVTTTREYVDNPLGGDAYVATSHAWSNLSFGPAVVRLSRSALDSVAYAYQDAPGNARFALPLQAERAHLFEPTTAAVETVVGTQGLSTSFHHQVPAGAFGVATGGEGRPPFEGPLKDLEVEGAFTLVLDFVEFAVSEPGTTSTFRTGSFRSEEGSLGPLAPQYKVERTFAVLRIGDGRLMTGAGPAGARFVSTEPTYHLAGTLLVPSAEGRLRMGETAHGMHAAPLAIEGEFKVQPRAASQAPSLLLDQPQPHVTAVMDGHADQVRLMGNPLVQAPARQALTAVSWGAVLAGLAVALWSALQKASPVLLPLYARLAGKQSLDNRLRLNLYETVRQRPFVHVRELQRIAGLGFGTVAYHVAVLRREGFIACVRGDKKDLLYVPVPRFSPAEMRALSLVANDPRRSIALALAQKGPLSHGELARLSGVDKGQLTRELRRLVEGGLVLPRDGRPSRYGPSRLLMAWLDGGTRAGAAS